MKKVFLIIVFIFIFLFGITLGGSFNNSQSHLFDEVKDKFESEITNPNNEYDSPLLIPKSNIINKTAKKLESTIDELIDKLFSFLN